MENYELTRVFIDTCGIIRDGHYQNSKGEEIPLVDVEKMKRQSKFYSSIDKIEKDKLPHYKTTKIYVENIDTFDKVIQMGSDAACLNMASNHCPGGGVKHGSRAQEECLCRRSNLMFSLESFTEFGKKDYNFQKTEEAGRYPIPTYGGIYSPCVNIFKTSKYYVTYETEPNITNVISVSAVNHPKLTEDGKIVKSYLPLMRGKIRTILRIAILHGHSKLVLGAFGCGAYGCPADHVAEIFREILDEEEFKHSFEEICFAIIEDANSRRNGIGNYKPFADIFGENIPSKKD